MLHPATVHSSPHAGKRAGVLDEYQIQYTDLPTGEYTLAAGLYTAGEARICPWAPMR